MPCSLSEGHSGPGPQFVGSMNLIGSGQGGPGGLGGVVQRNGQGGPGGMVLMQPPRGPSMGIPMSEPGGGGGPGHDWGAPGSIRGPMGGMYSSGGGNGGGGPPAGNLHGDIGDDVLDMFLKDGLPDDTDAF
mmetsp:Transcript_36283/g.58284  ORF Transcript_36283/g.58284 Transcript_36283/m.58284 type:complete len:131 (+) Transcript_36283:344-736(+)